MTTAVTPMMVKELRDKTGASMSECKKALDEATGDMDGAMEILRKRGAASAAKRADKSANEGVVMVKASPDGMSGVIAEINCETDFVARNAEFVDFTEKVAETLLTTRLEGDDLWGANIGTKTLRDLHNEMLGKFAEKIELRRFERVKTDGYVAPYLHTGNRLGVLLEFDTPLTKEESKAMARDIAMQIAAMNPTYADRSGVDTAAIEKEKAFHLDLAIQEGKKPEIAERIASGRLEKFYQENCLTEQTFVKDAAKTVTDVLKDVSALEGKEVKIRGFKRYFLGEGA